MRRRLMMGKEQDGGRLYIFKDGAYGDWLHGAQFEVGGYYQTNSSGAIATIEDSELILTFSINRNRTSLRSFGIALPSGVKPRRICATINRASLSAQWFGYIYLGASETFVSSANKDTAFTEFDEVSVHVPNGGNVLYSGELANDLDSSGYKYIYVAAFSGSSSGVTVKIPISEIWIE